MSQNQSYFWQTTRHNVYLKRSAKLQMLLALMAVLTFSTICVAELKQDLNDDTAMGLGAPTMMDTDILPNGKDIELVAANENDNKDAAKPTKMANGFLDAFSASISVILFTELGDKTFFIAAIMAMRHPRLIVFTGAILALALMTVLSVVFGMAATIIPKVYTYYISTALFAIFGLKMIYEGYFMKDTDAQEELEEVQSDLRKREDELLRATRGKYEDTTESGKRKNSNSDKEDSPKVGSPISASSAGVASGAGASSSSTSTLKNPENMQHRQRKQLANNNNNNNNNIIHSTKKKMNGCDEHGGGGDNDNNVDDYSESDVFLDGGSRGEHLKMTTFRQSPARSSSAQSNITEQTNCDSPAAGPGNRQGKDIAAAAKVHSANGKGAVAGGAGSTNSINSLTLDGAAGQSNGELKQLGGSQKRLERDVSAINVQDPESGIVRKNPKKGAAYFTTRVLMQAFTMTFVAEWGDRSQLTTILLAASKNVYGVVVGGIIGHSICTGLAVIGGRIVAAKISVRTVTILGGIVFLGFAAYALIVRPEDI